MVIEAGSIVVAATRGSRIGMARIPVGGVALVVIVIVIIAVVVISRRNS